MSYRYNQKSLPSYQSLWQDFRTRATAKQAQDAGAAATSLAGRGVGPDLSGLVGRATADEASGAKSQALRLVLASLLGGAALGGTVTGISGLTKLMRRPEPPSIPPELEMELPVPQKRAADTAGVPIFGSDWWAGDHAKSLLDLWWTMPAAVGAGAVGTLGTSALMEKLIKSKRKAQMDRELAGAKQEFDASMLGQYKKSSADPLDKLFDRAEKHGALTADTAQNPAEWAPLGVGAGITAAGLIGLLAAKGAYRISQGYTQEDLLNKALKNRAYLHSLRSPEPVVFTPKPTPTEDDSQ